MKTQSTLQRTLQALFITGIAIFALTPAFAQDLVKVTTDKRFEKDWRQFLGRFDDAVCARIEVDQEQGLILKFDARSVAIALNRLDTFTIIQAFGQHPRSKPETVRDALARIWIATLYGSKWLGRGSSNLVRT